MVIVNNTENVTLVIGYYLMINNLSIAMIQTSASESS